MPSGWPMRDRAAVHVHLRRVEPELADDGEALRGERLVQLDEVERRRRRRRRARAACAPPGPGRCPSRAGRRRRPRCRRTSRAARRRASRARSSDAITSAAAPSLIPDELPAVTVPPARNAGFSAASFSSVVSGRGCSSRTTSPTGTSSSSKRPASRGGRPALLRVERERVLVLARDAVALGDVLARLAHRLEREHRLHARVREAPAEVRVVDGDVAARERLVRLRDRERRARHRLDAAGDEQVAVAGHHRVAAPQRPPSGRTRTAGSRSRPRPTAAAPRAAPPCARRCGCPRPPGSRSRSRRPRSRSRRRPSARPPRRSTSAARSSGRTPESAPP